MTTATLGTIIDSIDRVESINGTTDDPEHITEFINNVDVNKTTGEVLIQGEMVDVIRIHDELKQIGHPPVEKKSIFSKLFSKNNCIPKHIPRNCLESKISDSKSKPSSMFEIVSIAGFAAPTPGKITLFALKKSLLFSIKSFTYSTPCLCKIFPLVYLFFLNQSANPCRYKDVNEFNGKFL